MSKQTHASPRLTPRGGAILGILAGLALLALPACTSSTGSGSTPGSNNAGTVTVNGTVLDIYGDPLPQAAVLIGGSTAVTGVDGTFTVTGVSVPYDLALYLDSNVTLSGHPTTIVYQGLTLAAPTVEAPASQGAGNTASVSGAFPKLSSLNNERGALIAGGAQYGGDPQSPSIPAGAVALDPTNTAGGTYPPLAVRWGDGANHATTLFALTADTDTNGAPTKYTGFAALSVMMSAGGSYTADVQPSSNKLTGATVTDTVTAPNGYVLSGSTLNVGQTILVRFTSGAAGAAISMKPGATSAYTPSDGNGVLDAAVVARAEPSNATNDDVYTMAVAGIPAGGHADLTLPLPPGPSTPQDGATGVAVGTTFSWGALGNRVYVVAMSPAASGSTDPELDVVTANTSTTLPDLSKLGVKLPSGTSYTYKILTAGPFASVDGLVKEPVFWIDGLGLLPEMFPYLANSNTGAPFMMTVRVPDLELTQSAAFTVTTK